MFVMLRRAASPLGFALALTDREDCSRGAAQNRTDGGEDAGSDAAGLGKGHAGIVGNCNYRQLVPGRFFEFHSFFNISPVDYTAFDCELDFLVELSTKSITCK